VQNLSLPEPELFQRGILIHEKAFHFLLNFLQLDYVATMSTMSMILFFSL